MSEFDVLIIGGGPAGSAAAIQSQQYKLRTCLIESSIFPRHKPGETLHPGIEPLLDKLTARNALSATNLRHNGNWVKWDNELRFIPFGEDENGPWLGFQVWRSNFDKLLLDRAKEVGVVVQQPVKALRLITEGEKILGISTSMGEIYARKFIDASGHTNWIARQLNISFKHYSPILIARYGYVEGSCPNLDSAPAIVADKNGWTWTARVCSNIYQWTRLTWEREKMLPDWRPLEFKKLSPIGKVKGCNVTWRMLSQASGSNYFVVGDAAIVLDPASSHGVIRGIMSGMMAAHKIYLEFNNYCNAREASKSYCDWLEEWFFKDVTNLKNIYAQLNSVPIWLKNNVKQ